MFATVLLQTKEEQMSRIDVVPAEKKKFKILVNFIQRGIEFNSDSLANKEAEKLHEQIPHAELNLFKSLA
jgi:hypothetical protein